ILKGSVALRVAPCKRSHESKTIGINKIRRRGGDTVGVVLVIVEEADAVSERVRRQQGQRRRCLIQPGVVVRSSDRHNIVKPTAERGPKGKGSVGYVTVSNFKKELACRISYSSCGSDPNQHDG